MTNTRRMTSGLAILAGALSFVGSAQAVDLIINGSFETVTGGTAVANGGHRDGTESGWTGVLSSYNYSSVYFEGPTIPASENPGSFYSWRHQSAVNAYSLFSTPTADLSYVTNYALKQTVTLTNALTGADIDAGKGHFAFSAWLASYGTPQQNPEQPYLALRFYDAAGSSPIGPAYVLDRTTTNFWVGNAGASAIVPLPAALTNPPTAGNHHWAKYARDSIIPQGSRKAAVYLTRSPNAQLSGSPDTYMDLVKLDVQSISSQPSALESAFPENGATNVPSIVAVGVTLRDGTTSVNSNSIVFSFDSNIVTAVVQKSGSVTTVQYNPPPLAGSTTHSYSIAFSDNGGPIANRTNLFLFTVLPAPPPPAFIFPPDHIVVLMDENRAYSEIVGNTNDAPYLNSLLPIAANFTDSHAEQHPTDPNYLFFFSGDNQGITGNSIPTNLPFTTPNLAAQLLNAGYTFVDYAEDLPFTGDTTPVVNGPHGTYYEEENVAGYWISTNQPPPSTNNLPPIVLQPLTNWPAADFRQLPNIAFVHSVEENDMHEGLWPNSSITISNGDFWIRATLESYIKWAMTNNSLFIFTYDESSSLSPDNQIPTFFIGPMIRPGNYTNTINHFNVLRTLEDIYHLPYAGAAATAAPITNIWIQPRISASNLGNGEIKLSWPGRATLQSAPSPTGPFTAVTNGFSPYVAPTIGARYYRLQSP